MEFAERLKEARDLIVRPASAKQIYVAGNYVGLLQLFHPGLIPITKLPKTLGEDALLLLLGDNDYTYDLYVQAKRQDMNTLVFTPGGKVKDLCFSDQSGYVKLPPKADYVCYLITVLRSLGIDVLDDVNKLRETLKSDAFTTRAKTLAEQLLETIPMIYCGDRFYPIALHWKNQFNQAGVHAFANKFPAAEVELNAFSNTQATYYAILLLDQDDKAVVKQYLANARDRLSQAGVANTELNITGKSLLVRVLTTLYLGEKTATCLAQLYGGSR